MLISATLAFASSAHTGQFWDSLSSSAKYAYVNGYSDAMSISIAELGGLNAAAEVFHWKGAPAIFRQLSNLSVTNLDTQLTINPLDKLYSDQKYCELELSGALERLTLRANQTAEGRSNDGQ